MEYKNYYKISVRELCHEVKERNPEAIKEMAKYFIENVDYSNSILIPVPQHEGYAIYTKEIAVLIAKETGVEILDIIKSKPRKTLYEMKKNKENIILGFYTTSKYDLRGKNILLLDNVLATGKTIRECEKAVGYKMKPVVYGAT